MSDEEMKPAMSDEERAIEEEMLKQMDFQTFESPANSAAEEHVLEVPDPAFERSNRKLDMLHDISLSISIELGRRMMMIREILELERGSIVEFDKLASEPVDILINGTKMAEGEVVVIDKHFGIRITTMLDPADRIKGLKK
ncbi:MAG TPA: flagellar motor switch protein FliN [Bacteroidota bacterium]|nr:flagellar motor switch protein FliN [Bacteroidota bacterium]